MNRNYHGFSNTSYNLKTTAVYYPGSENFIITRFKLPPPPHLINFDKYEMNVHVTSFSAFFNNFTG